MDGTEVYRLKRTEWAEADGKARLLEEMRKVVLSECKQRSGERTEAAKETAAYASPQYKKHIKEMTDARTRANVLLGEWKHLEMKFQWRRSIEATSRAEMQLR